MQCQRAIGYCAILIAVMAGVERSTAWGNTVSTWTGGDAAWTTRANWSGGIVPNQSTYDVVIDGRPDVASLVRINSPSRIIIGSLQLDSGDAVTVGAASSLTVFNSTTNAGTITASTGGTIYLYRAMQGDGRLIADGGNITALVPIVLTASGQPFMLQNGGTISFNSLDTKGYTASVTGGTLNVQTLLNTTGTVQVGAGGTLKLTNDSVPSSYTPSSDHDLELQPGSTLIANVVNSRYGFSVPAGATFSGTLNNANSTFTAAGSCQLGSLRNAGGVVNVSGTGNVTVQAELTGGTFNVADSASFAVAPTGSFASYGDFTLNGGTLTIGAGRYSNNVLPGTIVNNGTINLGGTGAMGNGSVVLAGEGIYNYTADLDGYHATLTNYGVLQGYGSICRNHGGGTDTKVFNHGTIRATPASGQTDYGFTFSGVTSVNDTDGQMIVDPGGKMTLAPEHFTSTGRIAVGVGGTLMFTLGEQTIASIENAGSIFINSSYVTVGRLSGGGSVRTTYIGALAVGHIDARSLLIEQNAPVTILAQPAESGIALQAIGALQLEYGVLTLMPAASSGCRAVLVADSIKYPDRDPEPNWRASLIDLANNDMILHNGTMADVNRRLRTGGNGGTWNGNTGIASSSAAADNLHRMALGAILNSDPSGAPVYQFFDGQPVSPTDILIKYTWCGDSDLDGKVDLERDFASFIHGLTGSATGWAGGDYNYDGNIDIAGDFAAFVSGYAANGSMDLLAAAIQTAPELMPGQRAEMLAMVPEPAGLILLSGLSVPMLLRRHGRRRDMR